MNRIFTAIVAGMMLPATVSAVPATVAQCDITAALKSAPVRAAAPLDGETVDMSRSCRSYVNVNGFVMPQNNYGSVARFVKADNGVCRLVYPVSEMNTEPIDGTVAGDKATFTLPQVVRQVTVDEDGESVTYDVVVAAFTEQELEEDYVTWAAAPDQTVVFDIAADGALTAADPAVMIGVGIDMGEYGVQWTGFGDTNVAMTPMTAKAVEVPASLETENYVVRSFDSPYIARVGFDGNDVYVQGMVSAMPDSWVKGTLADGKVTFANGQYLGVAQTANTFRNHVYCIVTTEDYDADWNLVYGDTEAPFVVDYDAEAKTFTFPTADYLYMSLDPTEVYARSSVNFVSLEYRGTFEPTTPPDPQIDNFVAYDPETGYGEIDFTMPDEGADGKVLDFSRYYYNIIVDGELYEVTPEIYGSVSSPMTDIPYGYTENNDIYSYSEGYHMFYFRIPEYRTIALQSVYIVDGVTNKSAVVLAGEAAIDAPVIEQSPVVSEQYFDLSGRRLARPSAGICIRRVTRADGSVEAAKVVVR